MTAPYRWLAAAALLVALLGGTWWHGHRAGAAAVQQRWDAQKLADSMQRDADAVVARQASQSYQATLAKIQGRAAGLQKDLRNALSQPIPVCPATVGDVVVPRVAIDGLRAAGADPSP